MEALFFPRWPRAKNLCMLRGLMQRTCPLTTSALYVPVGMGSSSHALSKFRRVKSCTEDLRTVFPKVNCPCPFVFFTPRWQSATNHFNSQPLSEEMNLVSRHWLEEMMLGIRKIQLCLSCRCCFCCSSGVKAGSSMPVWSPLTIIFNHHEYPVSAMVPPLSLFTTSDAITTHHQIIEHITKLCFIKIITKHHYEPDSPSLRSP